MKDKGFSYSNKIQQYHGDGRESIIVMGKPFKVIENLSATNKQSRRRLRKDPLNRSMVFLVENTKNLSSFPHHFALKRTIFKIDQVTEAHKEIEVLSRISDQNIIKSYHSEVTRHEGELGVSICTEFCTSSLAKRMKRLSEGGMGMRMMEEEIACVLIGVASALGYLHAQQPPIAYRNIHPKNILINMSKTGSLMYKLCNFSKATTDAFECANQEEGNRVMEDREAYGSLAFLAPEMADPMSGQRIDEQVDMWGLGVLLYSMLYSKLPFEGTISTLSKNPRYRPPATGSEYSSSFQTILQHLLEPDPKRRWNVFALINFLRFDEDIGRHLGTFCFTFTEYPDGWEEQDVWVFGRSKPPKKEPIRYDEGAPVAKVSDLQHNDDFVDERAPSASAPSDPEFQRALSLLETTGDIDDPRIAPFKDAIIKLQNEMLSTVSATRRTSTNAAPESAPTPSPPPQNDLDDLFGGPSPVPATTVHRDPLGSIFTAAHPVPASQTTPQAAVITADDLFAPVNSATTNAPLSGPPPMWGASAAPSPFGGPSISGTSSGVTDFPTPPQPGGFYANSNYMPAPPPAAAPPVDFFAPPSESAHSQDNKVNALPFHPGGVPNQPAVPANVEMQKKDPFEDLFS